MADSLTTPAAAIRPPPGKVVTVRSSSPFRWVLRLIVIAYLVFLAFLFVTLPFVVRTVQPVLIELEPEVEEAAASLGASRLTTFRTIILPALAPAITSGAALSFARGISEYGSLVLLSGNLPYSTEVASVRILSYVEGDKLTEAAAVASILLVVALVVIVVLDIISRRVARHG